MLIEKTREQSFFTDRTVTPALATKEGRERPYANRPVIIPKTPTGNIKAHTVPDDYPWD